MDQSRKGLKRGLHPLGSSTEPKHSKQERNVGVSIQVEGKKLKNSTKCERGKGGLNSRKEGNTPQF